MKVVNVLEDMLMVEVEKQDEVLVFKGEVTYSSVTLPINNFLMDGTLIDTSTLQLQEELIPLYKEYDIDQVIISHAHEDHTGTARWLQDHKQVPIYIHERSIADCNEKAEYPLYRKLVWGEREPFQSIPLKRTFSSRRYTWEAIYTPGHSSDHMAFYNQDKKILFSGDLFVTSKPKIIMKSESIPIIINSIKKVLDYDFNDMYCCHAGCLPNGKDMMRKKLEYLQTIEKKVLSLYKAGYNDKEINQKLFPIAPPIVSFSNHDWDSIHIVRSILDETI